LKERVTLTIDNEILEKIDGKVDGVTVKNRSHAVELLLIKALSSNRLQKAVILAGAENDKTRKVSILDIVQDRTLLEWNIKFLKRFGVKEIIVCMPKGRLDIKDKYTMSNMGISVTYIEEDFPLGTAGSIKALHEFVTETTVVCYSDDLKKIDLDDMYVFHKTNNKLCTLALTTVDDPSNFGVAIMNGNKISSFLERPPKDSAPSKLINSGIFIIEPDVLKYVPDGFSMFEQDVFPKLAKSENLIGYIFSGQWIQIRSKQDLEYAKKEWRGIK
jgi:NDP-sugar pyrophosphorylase family protein